MVEAAPSVEGECGLMWEGWRRLVGTVEDLGFSALQLAVHLVPPIPLDQASLEPIVGLISLCDEETIKLDSCIGVSHPSAGMNGHAPPAPAAPHRRGP
jgi:hypothetical protein